ncbi:MAG TPA: anti-sigma factor [Flavobacterium sp.]|jgi:archaellum component FlaF (FlaF/FlaG flagellin family)
METRGYIESGILELYVYGLLSEAENLEVAKMAKQHKEVHEEIVSIEKAIISLSSGFAPFLSPENFERLRERLELKHAIVLVETPKRRRNYAAYIGWAAALLLLLGVGYLFTQLSETYEKVEVVQQEKSKIEKTLEQVKLDKLQTETALAVVRDTSNVVVRLSGQAVAPKAIATVYWNRETLAVHVDASALPVPPEGMVYQVWALKLDPLTPTSIGLLENFAADDRKLFTLSSATEAEAFGITLEPAGGSETPTLEQLYTMGQI